MDEAPDPRIEELATTIMRAWQVYSDATSQVTSARDEALQTWEECKALCDLARQRAKAMGLSQPPRLPL